MFRPSSNPTSPKAPSQGASGIAVTLMLGWCAPGWAQAPAAAVVAQVESLNRFEAEQERLRQRLAEQPVGYEDRFFDPQEIERIMAEEPPPEDQTPGMRTVVVEGRLESTRQNHSSQPDLDDTGLGLRVEYHHETLNHGEWVLQADTRQRTGDSQGQVYLSPYALPTESRSGQRVTLRNLGFPVTPFVLADTNVGDINSEVTDGLTRGQQFSLGNSHLRGASAHFFAREFDLRVGLGARGELAGGPYAGYEKTQGDVAWLGYTRRFNDKLYAAVQVNRATDSPVAFDWRDDEPGLHNTTSLAAAIGHGYQLDNDGDTRVRLTTIHSRSEARHGAAPAIESKGLYLDGGLKTGRNRLEAGLYATDPSLQFGDQWVSSGNRGFYGRLQRNDLRVNWGLGLTHDRQKPAAATTALADWTQTGVNTYWTHQLGRRNSWGGNLQVTEQKRQRSDAGERALYGSVYYLDRWLRSLGDSRLQWSTRHNQSLVSNGPKATGDELTWEQDWWPTQEPGAQNPSLRTQLGWAWDRSLGETITYPTAGLTWQTWLPDDWSLNAALRYTSRRGNLATSRGLSGSVQTEKRFARQWTLGASLLMNQAVVNNHGASSFDSPVSISRSDDTSVWVFLRYELQQGRPYGYTLRGAQGAGTGRINGVVFLDANRDGVQQADEPGVSGVEVFLNLRQRTTTDAQGRYEFAVVPTGQQSLSLRPESVPLPWGEGPRSRLTVEVPLRGAVPAPLAVVKDLE